ncbi:hypothetical protein ACWFPY_05380 [Nocardia fluminea]
MLIAPIVPPSTSLDELIAGLRGTARMTATTTVSDTAYGMCTVGAAGRVHDRALLDALDWPASTPRPPSRRTASIPGRARPAGR